MFCPRCGNEVDEHLNFCSSCGARLQEGMIGDASGNAREPQNVRQVRREKKSRLPIIIVIIVLGVCLVGGILFFVGFGGSGKKGSANSLIWLSNDTLKIANNLNTKEIASYEIDTIRENYSDDNPFIVRMSPDGRYFYYFSRIEEGDVGTLYRAEIGRMQNEKNKDKYCIRIDNNVDTIVTGMNLFEDGTAVYKIKEGSITNIAYFDGEKSVSIAKNITDVTFFLEKSVIYSKEDGGKQAVYYQTLEEGSEAKKFVEGISEYTALNDKLVICRASSEEEEEEIQNHDLYVAGMDRKPELIASDVTSWNYAGESDIVYYYTEQSNMITLADAVTYDSYEEDKKTKEPDTSNPLYYDKNSGWWGSYTDAYYEAMDKYREAQNRLDIIERLKEAEYDLKTTALYAYHIESGKSEKLCGNITRNCVSFDNKKIAVGYFKGINQLQPVDITTIISEGYDSTVFYAENAIEQACIDKGALYFRIEAGEEQKVDIKDDTMYDNLDHLSVELFDKGNHIAYAIFNNNVGEEASYTDIYVAEVKEGDIGEFTSVNHSVSSISKYGERLVALDNLDSYIYLEDEMKVLGDNTINYLKCYADGTVYYVDANDGNLYTFDKHGDKTEVLDNVDNFSVLKNGDILYISDGNLCRYDGKENDIIDYNTYRYWTLSEKDIFE